MVSDGVPKMMISVLSILSFRKFELSHVFISCTQTAIFFLFGWIGKACMMCTFECHQHKNDS